MLLLFLGGGGAASSASAAVPFDVGLGAGLQRVDPIVHHRAPNRRSMWSPKVAGRNAVLRLADGR